MASFTGTRSATAAAAAIAIAVNLPAPPTTTTDISARPADIVANLPQQNPAPAPGPGYATVNNTPGSDMVQTESGPQMQWTGGSIWDIPGYDGYNTSFTGPNAPVNQQTGFTPSTDYGVYGTGNMGIGGYDYNRNLQSAYNAANISNWGDYAKYLMTGQQGPPPTYRSVNTPAFNSWWQNMVSGSPSGQFQEPGKQNFWQG